MFKNNRYFILIVFFIILAGALYFFYYRRDQTGLAPLSNPGSREEAVQTDRASKVNSIAPEKPAPAETGADDLYNFGDLGEKGIFKFSGQLSQNWSVQYVPEIEAVNIFLIGGNSESALENSQIFIRYFKADRFLTLSTVEILEREETEIGSYPAVRYKILKKPEIANFYRQPLWRSQEHQLIDIRYSPESPSIFYVIAKNPDLSGQDFDRFIDSLSFYNDVYK